MKQPLNQHGPCGEDFASLEAFDEHIISKPHVPPKDARCMSVGEMTEAGWKKDDRGRWRSPKTIEAAERLRSYHGK